MPVDYLIFCFENEPVMDALPVMKVTHYPFEPESYKPFAQGILCMSGSRLIIRLWAFEAKPEAASELAVALKGDTGRIFSLSVRLDGGMRVCLDGGETTLPIEIRPIAGEDLQGEYWGVDAALSEELTQAVGIGGSGGVLWGNIYKLCDGNRPHFGSFFPVQGRDSSQCPARLVITPF